MSKKESLIGELQNEAKSTRKMLELVPEDKYSWKPHEKSMTLGRLATHVAENPFWIFSIADNDEMDFAKLDYKETTAGSRDEMLKMFDDLSAKAIESLKKTTDEKLDQMWTLRNGEQVFFTWPRIDAIRMFGYSHFIHHRAQLGVYLRLLDVPLPAVYGSTADDKPGA